MLYSTKIVYSREQLLSLASSPLSHTPPKGNFYIVFTILAAC